MQNLHLTFDWHYIGQKKGKDFAKFCGLLRIYILYAMEPNPFLSSLLLRGKIFLEVAFEVFDIVAIVEIFLTLKQKVQI